MTPDKPPINPEKLMAFNGQPVTFIETIKVKDGVACDIYSFESDGTKDLGVVTVSAGFKTPLQKVLAGDKTIEGFVSGTGTLIITGKDGAERSHSFPNTDGVKEVEVKVGEIMQWEAVGDSELVFYEICYPPYKDGRFENLPG